MFGFIKNLFAGIFGFFGGLLGFKKSGYFLDLGDDQEQKSSKTEAAKPVAAQAMAVVTAPATSEAAKPEKSSSSKDKKSAKAKKESKPATSSEPKPEPVKIPVATNGKSSQPEPLLTFAPDHLAPIPTSARRLPGPSLNSFREMARQVKTK